MLYKTLWSNFTHCTSKYRVNLQSNFPVMSELWASICSNILMDRQGKTFQKCTTYIRSDSKSCSEEKIEIGRLSVRLAFEVKKLIPIKTVNSYNTRSEKVDNRISYGFYEEKKCCSSGLNIKNQLNIPIYIHRSNFSICLHLLGLKTMVSYMAISGLMIMIVNEQCSSIVQFAFCTPVFPFPAI